jgi:CRISPR-associated exonuclease Cas4
MIKKPNQDEFSQDDLIPLSAVADLVFCERRAALHFVEGTWEENQFTSEGHILHDKTHEVDCEMRKGLRTVRGLRIRSLKLGLSGVADVVEFRHLDSQVPAAGSDSNVRRGTAIPGLGGLWKPFPVEYKRGKLKHEKSYEIQLCAQALCLEEMLSVHIDEGAIFYGKSMRRHSVFITDSLRKETESSARRMHELIASTKTPAPVYAKRCESCSLIGECMPKKMEKKLSVKHYLQRMTTGET